MKPSVSRLIVSADRRECNWGCRVLSMYIEQKIDLLWTASAYNLN
jgi:hypothetical protein